MMKATALHKLLNVNQITRKQGGTGLLSVFSPFRFRNEPLAVILYFFITCGIAVRAVTRHGAISTDPGCTFRTDETGDPFWTGFSKVRHMCVLDMNLSACGNYSIKVLNVPNGSFTFDFKAFEISTNGFVRDWVIGAEGNL